MLLDDGAERIAGSDEPVERAAKESRIDRAAQAEAERHVVERRTGIELLTRPDQQLTLGQIGALEEVRLQRTAHRLAGAARDR